MYRLPCIAAVLLSSLALGANAFAITSCRYLKPQLQQMSSFAASSRTPVKSTRLQGITASAPSTRLAASPQDLDVVALVAGQENYGLALVALGEGVYSFLQAPSLSNIQVLVPPLVAALILAVVSGPMITSGDAASAGTGLWISTAVSLGLGASYVLRLLAPPYESLVPKEVAALGLLVATAGVFSFSQNLVVDGFVTLPSIPLPSLPMPPADNYPGWDI